MRQPHQILAFPYKKNKNDEYVYAIFKRSNKNEIWQGIAGGVEEGETYLEACKRELGEEAGISSNAKITPLESTCTIPSINITKDFLYKLDTYLVYEHSYGVDATNEDIKLSHEHTIYKWLTYEEAIKLLTYDSNKTALWELDMKLKNNEI